MNNTTSEGSASDPLLFPKHDYTVDTETVETSMGVVTETYRSYVYICYAANPVDTEYQSQSVGVPFEVDGVPVVDRYAPILSANEVGGIMSVRNVRARRMGGRSPSGNRNVSRKPDLAPVARYVLVSPGCRGCDNQAKDGLCYGSGPAATVDLKAAVR